VKTFNAALEAQYAGSVAAGTIAMFEPVLVCQHLISFPRREKSVQDGTGGSPLVLQEREKRMCHRHKSGEIDVDFAVELLQVEAGWVA
jgi:hypothetical protein